VATVALQDLTALVRPELERISAELPADLGPEHPDVADLVRLAGRYGGKQLRPAMVLLAGKAAGEITEAHIAVAKIVELIHTATLVHDDILDGAALRRRVPTLNALHGSEISVLLGDYVYARAFHMSVQLEDPACSRVLAEVTRIVCQGEIVQTLHRFDIAWTEEQYFRVIRDKTASLYGAACRLGGHYAGGAEPLLAELETYGVQLGTAFQIVDDCLDLAGEEAVVGKSLGTDFTKGKLTLPLLHIARGSPAAASRLVALMAQPGGLVRLHAEFDVEGAIAYAMQCAQAAVTRARDALRRVPAGPAREAMAQLGDYVLRRSL
jgi:octaprenyl-diphosphate synthase